MSMVILVQVLNRFLPPGCLCRLHDTLSISAGRQLYLLERPYERESFSKNTRKPFSRKLPDFFAVRNGTRVPECICLVYFPCGGKMRVLVIGSDGLLGRFVLSAFGADARGVDINELDITSREQVDSFIAAAKPEWIVNCAALSDVDLCERNPSLAMEVNSYGVSYLASTGVPLLTVSTDHVFNRPDSRPILEDEQVDPVNEYARSKLSGEKVVLAGAGNVVVRTSWLYGGCKGLIPVFWERFETNREVTAVTDQTSSPTYAPDLADAIVTIVRNGESGIFHLVNQGAMTPFGIAEGLSRILGKGRIIPTTWRELGVDAPRPACSVLGTGRGILLPPVWDSVERWVEDNV